MSAALTRRPATLADLDDIMAFEEQGFAPGNREARAVYARRIEVFPEGSLIALHKGVAVGCVFSELWRQPAAVQASHFTLGHDIGERHDRRGGDELYIASMTIAPAYRGRRLGSALFAATLADAARRFPQLRSTLLLVNTTWPRAHAIYTAAGFAEIARLPGFFTSHPDRCEDGIVMRRELIAHLHRKPVGCL
jgi:ribosomal protein S18 acetylase RimI-like enzyme